MLEPACYILENDKETVRKVGLDEWAKWFEQHEKRVIKQEEVGDVRVSTVFVGLRNELFETMIFGGDHEGYQARCYTREQADRQHEDAMKIVRDIKDGI